MFVGDVSGTYDASWLRTAYLDSAIKVNVPQLGYNQSGEIPLQVEYEFNTEGECMSFYLDLQSKVPVLANITLSAGGASRTLPNVALRPLSFQTIGIVSVRVKYPITFGMVALPITNP